MLKRKMFRDIKKNFSQFIAIFLMVAIGIATHTGIEAYMNGMDKTADKFYTENNLFDLQAIGKNFTTADLENAKKLDNIQTAERKLSLHATTDHDHLLFLNFIESNEISRFYVLNGEGFNAEKSGIWLDADHARLNHLQVGDVINVKFNQIELKPTILGLINTPDHLYDTKDTSELIPNRQENGFAYMSAQVLPESQRIFNYLMFDLKDTTKIDETKNLIEENIKSSLALITRENTASYSAYQGEIDEGKTYVGVFSGLFIFIALLSVITTMTRVVKKQRTEIGILKSLGFSNFSILCHYLSYSFFVSVLGVIAGLIVGFFWIGNFFMSLQMDFFEIPNGLPIINPNSYLVSILVIIGISFVTFLTSRHILQEKPAETLRKKIPYVKKNSLNITQHKLFQNLKFSRKWNLRDIIRNKTRTFMGIAGVTGCTLLIVTALGMLDSMHHFIKIQFEDICNFNYKLVLKNDIIPSQLQAIKDKYGDSTSKTFGIEIKTGHKKESNNLVVTDAKDKLRFLDQTDNFTTIDSATGVYVTYKLAETKGYKLGDEISWHIYGDDTYYTSKIVGFNKDPQNQNLTMTRAYFESLNLPYFPDTVYTDQDLSTVKEIIGVDLIQDIDSLKTSMSTMLQMMESMIKLIICVAVLLCVVIIYNLGILSFTEKQYQFATLKVLGFSNRKIKDIFTQQNNWIAIVAIIFGLPLGFQLVNWLFKTAIEENYDFSAHIELLTYIIASIGTFLVSFLVSKFLARKIKTVDMVSSLKGNE